MKNCFAVDHDIKALKNLTKYIISSSNYNLIGCCSCPIEAIKKIKSAGLIHIIFVDLDILPLIELELSNLIPKGSIKIIMTSSNISQIADDMRTNFDGYLLKPYSLPKLTTFFEKYCLKNLEHDHGGDDDFFYCRAKGSKNHFLKVKLEDIVAIESKRNYLQLYTTSRSITIYMTLLKITEFISSNSDIIQIHRSFLISLKHIEEINNNIITLSGNIKVTIGNKYKDKILLYLKTKIINY